MPGLAATPRPAEGAVSWNITRACNYRCAYCTQRAAAHRDHRDQEVPAFLEAFGRLPGPWEVKLSGGEPFAHPGLVDIVAGLSALGHRVSVVTNFSAPDELLQAFLEATGGRAGVFSCSLHPQYVPRPAEFFARAARLAADLRRRALPSLPAPTVSVSVVATRAMLPHLALLREQAAEHGLALKLQPEKQDRDVIAYSPREQDLLLALGGHNLTGSIAHDFSGRPCWAGARYFILDERGTAHRCYPARRWRRSEGRSILDPGFRLAGGPAPCPFPYCNCTVPIARCMMPVEVSP